MIIIAANKYCMTAWECVDDSKNGQHLLRTYGLGVMLSTLYFLSHAILEITLHDGFYHYYHFIDKKTTAS